VAGSVVAGARPGADEARRAGSRPVVAAGTPRVAPFASAVGRSDRTDPFELDPDPFADGADASSGNSPAEPDGSVAARVVLSADAGILTVSTDAAAWTVTVCTADGEDVRGLARSGEIASAGAPTASAGDWDTIMRTGSGARTSHMCAPTAAASNTAVRPNRCQNGGCGEGPSGV
jgi:hypothetical protein